MATSGMPMFALLARRCTLATNHRSVSFCGVSMTCAPVDHFAIGFEIKSEINEPVKPTTAENANNIHKFRPLAVINWLTPSALVTIVSTSMMAILVSRNKNTRFIDDTPEWITCLMQFYRLFSAFSPRFVIR